MAHGKHFLVAVRGVHREDSDARFRQLVSGFVAGLRTAGYAAEQVVQDWEHAQADTSTVAAGIAGQPEVRELHRERAAAEVEAAKAPVEPGPPSEEPSEGNGEPEQPEPGTPLWGDVVLKPEEPSA